MTDTLRDKIAAIIANTQLDDGVVCDIVPTAAADAILTDPTLAVIELPTEPTASDEHRAVWECEPYKITVRDDVIFSGMPYWCPAKGDDPTPFAAALIAAYRHTQEPK